MDRRSFLATAGAAGGALAIPTLFTPKAKALVSIPTASFYSAGAFHAAAIGSTNPANYSNISIATQQIVNIWKAYNLDVALRPGFNTVTEAMISPSHINCAQIAANLAPYHTMTAAQVATTIQVFLNKCNLYHPGLISSALNTIRTVGMANYLQGAANVAQTIASTPGILSQTAGIIRPNFTAPPGPHPQGESCKVSATGLFFGGVALTVLTVMTDGLDLLVAAGWAAVIYYAGIGLAGWSIIHEMVCN